MNKVATVPDGDVKDFSVIKFFSEFEKAVSRIGTYPLTKDNLTIQQDAYKRLASTSGYDETDNDPESFEEFATLECGRKEKDTDMRFELILTPTLFVLNVEGLETLIFTYADCFKNEKDASSQLIALLTMLSNGQLTNLLTTRYGATCAIETLLFARGERVPTLIGTNAHYPWWWKAQDTSDYDVALLKNTYIKRQIDVPKDFFFIDKDASGNPLPKGRVFTSPEFTPLYKGDYQFAAIESYQRRAGKKADQQTTGFLYSSWEFWVFMMAFIASCLGMSALGLMPKFVQDYPVVLLPVTTFLAYFIVVPLLEHKEHLRASHPNHPWIIFDNKLKGERLKKEIWTAVISGGALVSLALTFGPIYITKNSGSAVNLYQLMHDKQAWMAPAILFAVGSLLVWSRNIIRFVLGSVSVVAGGIMMLAINGLFSNADVYAPEPFDTLASIVYVIFPIAVIVITVVKLLQRRKTLVSGKKGNDVNRRLELLHQIRLQVCYFAAVAIIASGFMFKGHVEPKYLLHGTPNTFLATVFGFGGVLLVISILAQFNIIKHRAVSGWCIAQFILIMLTLGYSLSENTDGLPNGPFWLLFGASFAQLGVNGLYSALNARNDHREMAKRLLAND